MGTRTLHARLTARILVLGAAVLLAVGLSSLLVCNHLLDASDTNEARSDAINARDAFARELAEGDAPAEGADEVLSGATATGIRLVLESAAGDNFATAGAIPPIAANTCTTFVDETRSTWRACATDADASRARAAVRIDAHLQAMRTLSLVMIGLLALAMLLLWLGVRSAIGEPIAELTRLVDWTSRIAETDDVAPPAPVTTTTEIARLETAFAALLRRILEALSRERATGAHIAHELRTPLTAILAELESLPLADPSSRDAVARIRTDVARLADVIDAILVLSSKRKDAAGLLVNVADLARDLAPKEATVEAPDEALVEGDERLLVLAIRNLLENAVKYGRGVKTLRVARENAGVRLSVTDDGPGLDSASRTRMFDRYWRSAADGDGRGLGLALVRAVAERHGGHASADVGSDGKGLVVSFFLEPCVTWNDREAPR